MKRTHEHIHSIRELHEEELRQATGGYDDIPYCGTVPRRFPPRPPSPYGPGVIHPVEVLN
jgi:hypothetical protein